MTSCAQSILPASSNFQIEQGFMQIEELKRLLTENPDDEELINQVIELSEQSTIVLSLEKAGSLGRGFGFLNPVHFWRNRR
jgi:fatty acid-binding protein DegV